MKKITVFLLSLSFLLASSPGIWEREGVKDFLKGKLKGISLSWQGVLSPSFKLSKLPEVKESYILALTKTREGIFVGTGHEGKLFLIKPDGKVKLIYDSAELDIFTIAVGPKGEVYFATSPRGKIYKYKKGKVEEFFDPDERFIWKIKYINGHLYAATGKPSVLYKIDLKGSGEKLVELPDSQILDFLYENGKIYIATSDKGRVYEVVKKNPRLLWESSYREVNSIALWNGKIYAATQGKRAKKKSSGKTDADAVVSATLSIDVVVVGGTTTSTTPSSKALPSTVGKKKSVVYEIDPGSREVREFWDNPEEYVSALVVHNNNLYAATGGKRARIFQLVGRGKANLFEEAEGREIRTVISAGNLYFSTSVPVAIYKVEKVKEDAGVYISDVLDAKGQSRWGEVSFEGSGVEVQTRSGNSSVPDSTWEDWSPSIRSEGKVLSPPSRYLQYRVRFNANGKFSSIKISYLKHNQEPRIENIKIYPPNVVFVSYTRETIRGLPSSIGEGKKKGHKQVSVTGKRVSKKGYRTVKWVAKDPDGDSLVYNIYLEVGRGKLITLEKNWDDNYYVFDTTFFPDGKYRIKIVASDLPSNTESDALKTEKISRSFLIDNTPPIINVSREGNTYVVKVEDPGSGVKELRYSKDGKNWILLSPEDGICDGKQEVFRIKAKGIFALRAVDRHGNVKTLPIRR